jgi:hypothetical protein
MGEPVGWVRDRAEWDGTEIRRERRNPMMLERAGEIRDGGDVFLEKWHISLSKVRIRKFDAPNEEGRVHSRIVVRRGL